ncbi:MAG: hypothetical protein WC413_02165 [Candidatus Nanoarchaeia archaeon]
MAIKIKKLCGNCKKNYVVTTSNQNYVVCYDCQKESLKKEIKDPKMKKLFDLPEEWYKESSFLRSVKLYYLKFGTITEKQLEYFKKAVEKLKKS